MQPATPEPKRQPFSVRHEESYPPEPAADPGDAGSGAVDLPGGGGTSGEFEPEKVGPRLQRLLAIQSGALRLDGEMAVSVGLRVEAGEVWAQVLAVVEQRFGEDPPESVVIDSVTASPANSDESYITARVRLVDLREILTFDAIRYADGPAPTIFDLDVSGAEVGAVAAHSDPNQPLTGAGVVVGIVDRGIDLDHPGFKHIDGRTRIAELWDQGLDPLLPNESFPAGRSYGVGWTASDIDAGHASRHAASSHGTQVAGIAAGNGRDAGGTSTTYVGMAPDADLVVVALEAPGGISNSAHVVDAVDFVIRAAGRLQRPCVINLSLGEPTGAHNGTSQVETMLASYIAAGHVVVKSAGNDGDNGSHAAGDVPAGATVDLEFDLPLGGPALQALQVWYGPGERLDMQLIAPGRPASHVILSPSLPSSIPWPTETALVHSQRGVGAAGDGLISPLLCREIRIWRAGNGHCG